MVPKDQACVPFRHSHAAYRKVCDMLVPLNTLLRRAIVSAHVAPQMGRSGAITSPIVIMGILTIGSLCALLRMPRITQDQNYHEFVDQRTLLGIPNFWNVVSNVPFIVVGVAGLRRFYHDPATTVLFLGIFLTGFGSSYYHWNPNDSTLFWDRLPMTLCFMAILAIAIEERVNARAGAALLWPLLAIG
jgi:ceramidase